MGQKDSGAVRGGAGQVRRQATLLAAAAALLAGAGACAAAAAPVRAAARSAKFTQGDPTKGSGARLTIGKYRFSVQVVRFPEECTYDEKTFTDYFTFRSGSRVHLTGAVKSSGVFTGTWGDSFNHVTVTGRVKGDKATVKVTEHGVYNPASNAHPNACQGSRTFLTKRAGT
jgi:hypothetical protein